MEGGIFLVYSFFYLIFKACFGDNEYQHVKDARRFNEGLRLLRLRDYPSALAYFNDAVEEHPRSGLAWLSRARCHLVLGNPYAALADSSKAANLDYNLPNVFLYKGRALFDIQEYREAYLQFDRAIWHDRNNAAAFRWRAFAHRELGETNRMESDLKKAQALGDEDANHLLRQLSYAAKGGR